MDHVLTLIYLTLSGCLFITGVSPLGINYGQVGDNLPAPITVLKLLNSLNITKARIYDTNPQILTAFGNSSVELIVTVENELLSTLTDPLNGLQWVTTRIVPFLPATRITGIFVGNEVFTDSDQILKVNLVPAIFSIYRALVELGLDKVIHVSTPCSLGVLSESFPPSSGAFKDDDVNTMVDFFNFLSSTRSPFWINAYPYFAYKDNPNEVSLNYVLFNDNDGTVDPLTGLTYDNMLYAQVDAVIFAMAKLGFNAIEIRVAETGWPSMGDADEVGATIANAVVYNRNLLTRQTRGEGTPLRPGLSLEIYVFALFNEDRKTGPTSERNYGLFEPNCTMVYNVGLSSVVKDNNDGGQTTSSASLFLASLARKEINGGLHVLGVFGLMVVMVLQYI